MAWRRSKLRSAPTARGRADSSIDFPCDATMNFYFKLEFSSQGVSAELLNALTSQVLRHVGSSLDAVPEVMPALHQAVASGTSGIAGPADQSRRCDVQFRAHG